MKIKAHMNERLSVRARVCVSVCAMGTMKTKSSYDNDFERMRSRLFDIQMCEHI